MNPFLAAKIAVALVVIVGAFFVGRRLEQNYWLEREAQLITSALEEKQRLEEKGRLLSEAFQQQLTIANAAKKKRSVEVRNETKKPAYDCPLPSDGLRILKSTIDTANGAQ
jgi:hypothetical protein